jgi:nucleotide-binding universal stress UspA family protein
MTKLWRSILVPHDFSGSANHAAAIARDQAKGHDGEIALLHVVELPSFGADATLVVTDKQAMPVSIREYAVTAAEAHLEEIAQRLRTDGVRVTTAVRVGNPVDEINRFAQERGCGLIAMGTHGRTGVRRLIAGSVTERVVRTSEVPVLALRHP